MQWLKLRGTTEDYQPSSIKSLNLEILRFSILANPDLDGWLVLLPIIAPSTTTCSISPTVSSISCITLSNFDCSLQSFNTNSAQTEQNGKFSTLQFPSGIFESGIPIWEHKFSINLLSFAWCSWGNSVGSTTMFGQNKQVVFICCWLGSITTCPEMPVALPLKGELMQSVTVEENTPLGVELGGLFWTEFAAPTRPLLFLNAMIPTSNFCRTLYSLNFIVLLDLKMITLTSRINLK